MLDRLLWLKFFGTDGKELDNKLKLIILVLFEGSYHVFGEALRHLLLVGLVVSGRNWNPPLIVFLLKRETTEPIKMYQ